jgi:DNA-binding PadR family transcriptional regulator
MMNNLGNRLIEFHVLTILSKKPMHGYALMTAIKKQLKINVGPSTVYPLLYNLERERLVVGKWDMKDRPKKTYELTAQGRAFLGANAIELKILVAPLLTV